MDVKFVVLWTDTLIYSIIVAVIALIYWIRKREHLRKPWHQVGKHRLAMVALVILLTFISITFLDSIHIRQTLPNYLPNHSLQPPLKPGNNPNNSDHFNDNPENHTQHNATPNNKYYDSTGVKSLLDLMLSPLGEYSEKSYSAPFATHLQMKETVFLPNGQQERIYLRLRYGGTHLNDPNRIAGDVLTTIAVETLKALLVWLSLCVIIFFLRASRERAKRIAGDESGEILPKKYKAAGITWIMEIVRQARIIFSGETSLAWREVLCTLGIIICITMVSLGLAQHYHILGTDKVGQDIFYATLKSIRTGFVIGGVTLVFMLPFSMFLGISAGYFGGWIDDIIQYIYTLLSSVPSVLLIVAAVLSLQIFIANHAAVFPTLVERADVRLLALCIILGVTGWTPLCRLLRGEALKLRDIEFVEAACALGVSHFKIITRHILPNVMPIILITAVLDFSAFVLAEAVLSYVGVGVDPTTFSWGNMINSARLELARVPTVWWPLCAAFIFMFTLVLSVNVFADAVRDAFDPKYKN